MAQSKAKESLENLGPPTGERASTTAADSRWSGIKTLLVTSGPRLPGVIVERSVFERGTEGGAGIPPFLLGGRAVVPPPEGHIVVVHDSAPINLQWRQGRRFRNSLILPGHVIVNPAGQTEPYAWDKRTEVVRVWLALDSAHLGPSEPTLRPAIGVHDPLLAQLGRYLARAFEMGGPGDSLYADALAHALGAHLVQNYGDRPTGRQARAPGDLGRRQLQQVCDYIEANLHRTLTVAELATIAGVSPTHFTRLFRRQTGEPPHRYVRDRRLDRAEGLILGTRLSLGEIAAVVGFSDHSHLNRVMRAQRGLTPGQMRNSFK